MFFFDICLCYYTKMMMTQSAFQCLDSWGKSVARKDKTAVLNHYVDTGTLWPTLSNELRQGHDTYW